MGTPSQAERRLMAAGARKGATWGTALALGSGYGTLINSLSGFARAQDYDPGKEADAPFARTSSLLDIKPVDFTIGYDMRYDPGKLGMLLAMLYGTAGSPSPSGSAYKHTFQSADSNYGLFATFAAEFPGKIFEVPSAKVTEWHIKVNKGLMDGELKLRGNTLINDSQVNGDTQMGALSYPDRHNRMRFSECVIKMNAETVATAVTAASALEVNSLDVTCKRTGHDSVYAAGGPSIIESVESGQPDFRIKLGFPRMDTVNAANLATFIAETTQKMLIMFTGVVAASTDHYSFGLYFPRLKMVHPEYNWTEIINSGLELVAEEAAQAPTGMTYTRPYIELVNLQTTDYLAS
jgi:hypothetical protein